MSGPQQNAGSSSSGVVVASDKALLVELRHGKLNLKQKLLAFDKITETMQEIVKFREMLEDRVNKNQGPLTTISEESKPVIAKLAHESDKSITALAKHIQNELLPLHDTDDDELSEAVSKVLPLSVIEGAIKDIASRNNYGLDTIPGGGKVPAALHIWRWEVKEAFKDWLPKSAKDKIEARIADRHQAKKDAKVWFEGLSEAEQNKLVGTKVAAKGQVRVPAVVPESDAAGTAGGPQTPSQRSEKDQAKGTEASREEELHTEDGAKKTVGRPKKPIDPEKALKEKERLEKKAAKEQKEQRDREAQNKSRSIMANFFGKPAANKASGNRTPATAESGSSAMSGPSQSDFQKTFKPFALKKDAELAPVNWFRSRQRKAIEQRVDDDIIILDNTEDDGEDFTMRDASSSKPLGQMTAEERLQDVLSHLPVSKHARSRRRTSRSSQFKSSSPYEVRAIMSALSEAEVTGDDEKVRSLLKLLRNRTLIPAKVLIFTEDLRPGYFGTWTRPSRDVGPRTPFAKDIIAFDYGYDSGEEWEDEAGEADDVAEDAEDDDAGADESDSDLDSWLVDDDEVEEPGTPIEDRGGSPGFPEDIPLSQPKRKAEDDGRQNKKRKVVVPLVPFTKGPCWETVIGRCQYEPFNAYRIKLFNDTPFPIDPFTFVSPQVDEVNHAHATHATQSIDVTYSADGFVVPALPPHMTPTLATSAVNAAASTTTPTKRPPGPKKPFPDAHIPLLLRRIEQFPTSSIQVITELLFTELIAFKVKKNSIEAKIREVAEKKYKDKQYGKVWVVKPEMMSRLYGTPSQSDSVSFHPEVL